MTFALLSRAGVAAALLAAATFAPAPAVAQAKVEAPSGAYKLDPTHATITFSAVHVGLSNYAMRFLKFDAALTLDVEDPTKSSVTANIDVKSVDTSQPDPALKTKFDTEIANDPRFLDGEKHPEITFASKSIEMTGDTTAKITGDITIRGVTREITMDAELTGSIKEHPFGGKKPAVGFRGEGVIDRREFGFTFLTNLLPNGASIVSPEVTFVVTAEFILAD